MKVLFTGGGTMGPVTPLLAVAEAWKKIDPHATFVWVGTRSGPERETVEAAGIRFLHIPVFRLPRNPSLEWLLLPFRFVGSCAMAWMTISREKPDLIANAGGYTGVPLVWAGKVRGVKCWVHQQDATTLLSTRLTVPFADCVTVAWKQLLPSYPSAKTDWIGNPVRPSFLLGKKDRAFERFGLDLRLPTVLVTGGGTGSAWLNAMMEEAGEAISSEANVIHVTGHEKMTPRLKAMGKRYHATEFLAEGMDDAYAAADLVMARAGMATITELAAWKKPAILVPLPHSPQETNAKILAEAGAAVLLNQAVSGVGDVKAAILGLLRDAKRRDQLSRRIGDILPTDVAEEIARHVIRHTR